MNGQYAAALREVGSLLQCVDTRTSVFLGHQADGRRSFFEIPHRLSRTQAGYRGALNLMTIQRGFKRPSKTGRGRDHSYLAGRDTELPHTADYEIRILTVRDPHDQT
jgi:hypothetical protein